MSLTSEMRKLVRQLEDEGWTVERTRSSGHYRLSRPDVAKPIWTSSTPSKSSSFRNFQAEVRRATRGARAV